ncbi:DUF637 domain-containing protein, partial [Ralstonia solanacearum]
SIVASKSLELLANNPIRNTGTLGSYGTLTTNTTIVNEQRAAEMTAAWQPIEDGWARTTGQQGQANSGFVFAANAADIAGQIRNINGVVAQLNADGSMSAAEAARVAAAVQAGVQAVTSTHTDTFVRSPDIMGEVFAGVVIAVLAVMTGGALGPALSGLASGTFGATVTGGAVGSMTGSAIGQFAANDGINFGKLFTAGAVGALTAGIANGVTVAADGSLGTAMDWSQKVAKNSLAGMAGAQSVAGTTMTQAAGSTATNIVQRAEALLVMSAATAGVNTVAYGGSFGRAFANSLASNAAAAGAYAIGDGLPGIGAAGATPGSITANVAMHGLLGCAAQSIINGSCAGGAAGAMSSAILAPLVRDSLYGASDTQTAFPNADGSITDAYRNPVFNMVAVALSGLAGGAVANALGTSATAGAAAAHNEALNNATETHRRFPILIPGPTWPIQLGAELGLQAKGRVNNDAAHGPADPLGDVTGNGRQPPTAGAPATPVMLPACGLFAPICMLVSLLVPGTPDRLPNIAIASNSNGGSDNGNGGNQFSTTDSVTVNGNRAVDKAQTYESAVQKMYNNAPHADREYTAIVNGQRVNGVADDVTTINGRVTAVEAKYVDDWSTSLRNPNSKYGKAPWAVAEQENMVAQAKKYSAGFEGGVVYHTNSPDLAAYYSKVFSDAGIKSFKFVITPVR